MSAPPPVDDAALVRDAQARASRAQRRHRLHVLELRRAARLEQERRAAELAARARLASTAGVTAVWRALVGCEAGGRWRYGAPDVGTDPGYDFEGGPNFTHGTWLAYRPRGFPDHAYDATPAQQVLVARRVLADQGVGAWPVCGPRVGLRRGD